MAMGWFYDNTTKKYQYGEDPSASPNLNAPKGALLDQNNAPVTLDYSKDVGPEADRGRATIERLNQQTQEANQSADASAIEKTPGAEGKSGYGEETTKAVQTAISGGSPIDMAGSGLTTAGMASGQPELVAAGLGLSAMGAIQKNKNQQRQNKYLAEVERIKARQDAISKLANIGQGMRA
jgi:hypothetical protein